MFSGILKLLFALITFIIRKEVVDIIVCTKIKKKNPLDTHAVPFHLLMV